MSISEKHAHFLARKYQVDPDVVMAYVRPFVDIDRSMRSLFARKDRYRNRAMLQSIWRHSSKVIEMDYCDLDEPDWFRAKEKLIDENGEILHRHWPDFFSLRPPGRRQ